MAFLIDITDPRFSIPENSDVIEFIRRANPFAHTDVGSILFDLAKEIDGISAYRPSPSSCAYVVLHDNANRIFAIAYGQQGLAFRLDGSDHAEALDDVGDHSNDIGPDWVRLDPWCPRPFKGVNPRLLMWAKRASADAKT